MKFLHTADWQIGMKAAHAGDQAQRVRDARLVSAERVMQLARSESVEFVLVAGDTFEDQAVDRKLVSKVAEILESAPCPVFVLPGNHDPLVPGSVWEHAIWKTLRQVRVVSETGEIPLENGAAGGTLFTAPLKAKYGKQNPVAWIDAKSRGEICIGLAHGTVQHAPQDCNDFPMPRTAAVDAGLDYLAIGHWHSTLVYQQSGASGILAYSGTHETTKFGERDSGNALVVEIASRGAKPTIATHATSQLRWISIDATFHTDADLESLRTQLLAISNPSHALLECTVKGLLTPALQAELDAFLHEISGRFLLARFDTSQLHAPPSDSSWLDALPAGVLRRTGEKLRSQASLAPEGSPTAIVAQQAMLELFRLLKEVTK